MFDEWQQIYTYNFKESLFFIGECTLLLLPCECIPIIYIHYFLSV